MDTLDLSGMGFVDVADALSAFSDFTGFGGGTQFMIGSDHLVVLGMSAADLADDIDLGALV